MAKKKPPRRLFKQGEALSLYKADRSPRARMKQMSRDHQDVLQNIEFVLVSEHQKNLEIDDSRANAALVASLAGVDPETLDDILVADLVNALASIRQLREEVPDDIWREGLRVVQESVRRHSGLQQGETSYLEFVKQYIK